MVLPDFAPLFRSGESGRQGTAMVRKTKEAALATREALIDAAERVFRREAVVIG